MIFLMIKHAHFQTLVLLNIMHNGIIDKIFVPCAKPVNFSSRHQPVTSYSESCFLGCLFCRD